MTRLARAVRVALSAVVVLLVATTAGAVVAFALTAEPVKTTPIPAVAVLAHARTSCGVDRFDEVAQTRAGRWTDLSGPALGCLLNAVSAPADLAADVVDKSPGYWTRQWDTATAVWSARWQWGQAGYVITVHLDPKDPR
jgi:hypothetical protein